ncbi:hypothetical protein G3580_17745 [Nitrogeniibacter mangrovi]|uniref:Uncharacterized protein n=1 Tax=Nitrogeniibacter mangrovi TaxID=2016596 RepID=A0A6C1B6D9_9RHOO|nr:hypothetical protein [Nitrogeniibacter mangrovi]QID19296.1 hypothetical protein G3580_17745 [Nitrogeniibacter mangrovi]
MIAASFSHDRMAVPRCPELRRPRTSADLTPASPADDTKKVCCAISTCCRKLAHELLREFQMGTRLFSFVRLGLLVIAMSTCAAAFAGPDAPGTPAAAPSRETGFVSGMEVTGKAANAPAVADTGIRSGDPYRAMIDDMLATPRQGRVPDAAATAHDSSTLFYDEKELQARAASFKAELSAILGDDTPAEQSAEERELTLKKEIAMRAAYADSAAGGRQGHTSQADDTGRLRMIELAFLMWDILTHPLTLSLIALYGLARLAIAILRVARDPHGRKRRQRHGSSRGPATVARPSQPPPSRTPEACSAEPRRRGHRSSRRRRSRGSFLDRFRSI